MTNDRNATGDTQNECPWCQRTLRADETAACKACGEKMCDDCAYTCEACGAEVCESCEHSCHGCDSTCCDDCIRECDMCSNQTCFDCGRTCVACDARLCDDCAAACAACDDYVCDDCRSVCENCGEILCGGCVEWDDDYGYCPTCMENIRKYPEYSRERLERMRSHDHMFTVGLEIEINGGHDHDMLKGNPLIAGYCRDGSLWDGGMEYQTDILFTTDFDAIATLVESIRTESDEPERAGGHMHVRRTRRQTASRWYWALKGLTDQQARHLNMRHTTGCRWCELRHGDYSGKDTAVNDDHDDTIELRTFARWDETTAHRLTPALEWAHHMWRYFEHHDLYQLKTAGIMRESARSAYATPRTTPTMRLAVRKED